MVGIRLKLTIPIILLWCILYGGFNFYWLPAYFEEDLHRYRIQQEQKIDLLFSGLIESLISEDLAHVYSSIHRTLKRQKEWQAITVWDTVGMEIFPLEHKTIPSNSQYQTIHYQIYSTDSLIATVKLIVNPSQLFTEQDQQILRLQWLFFSIFIISVLASISLEEKLIRRPISRLSDAADRLGNRDFSVQLPITNNDEIGQLVSAFDTMRSSLQHYHQNLEQARDDALIATRAKSEFLAKMSHELRTPLNAIIGYSEIIEEELQENCINSHTDDLAHIKHAGKHLLSLINDILDLSKVEVGKAELDIGRISLQNLLNEVVASMQALAKKNKNSIEIIQTSQLDDIYSDSGKLRKILFNMLSNACKFTEKGQIGIYVYPCSFQSQAYFEIVIEDTGIGIPENQLERLFDAFSQLDDSYSRRYQGTGLGLTICHQLCKLMQGEITVQSELGKGTTCRCLLPVNLTSAQEILSHRTEIAS